jgi:hypothetical protein
VLRAAAALGLWVLILVPSALAAKHVDRVEISDKGVVVVRSGDRDTVDARDSSESSTKDDGGIQVSDHGDAEVRLFGDIHVPRGKRVSDDVVAVFGSVDVEGEVEGDVVAVLGTIHVADGAVIHGQAVSVGGAVEQEPGATINGETVSVGFFPVSWGVPALPLTLSAIAAGWVTAVFTGWIFALVFPARLLRVATTASRRTGASLMLGMVSLPGFVAALVLLVVTVVGIPLAFLLPFAYLLLVYGGQLAATYVLGCKLVRRPLGSPGLLWPTVAGALLVAIFFTVGAVLFVAPGVARPFGLFSGLLGALLVTGLTAIGTGAFLLSKLGSEPKSVSWGTEMHAPLPSGIPVPPPPTV